MSRKPKNEELPIAVADPGPLKTFDGGKPRPLQHVRTITIGTASLPLGEKQMLLSDKPLRFRKPR